MYFHWFFLRMVNIEFNDDNVTIPNKCLKIASKMIPQGENFLLLQKRGLVAIVEGILNYIHSVCCSKKSSSKYLSDLFYLVWRKR